MKSNNKDAIDIESYYEKFQKKEEEDEITRIKNDLIKQMDILSIEENQINDDNDKAIDYLNKLKIFINKKENNNLDKEFVIYLNQRKYFMAQIALFIQRKFNIQDSEFFDEYIKRGKYSEDIEKQKKNIKSILQKKENIFTFFNNNISRYYGSAEFWKVISKIGMVAIGIIGGYFIYKKIRIKEN